MRKADRLPPLVFFHIPKTAGMALLRFLRLLYGREAVCRVLIDSEDMKSAAKVWAGHLNWQQYSQHRREGDVSLIFFRNPRDRLLSAIYFAKAQLKHGYGWFGDTSYYDFPLKMILSRAVEDHACEHYGAIKNTYLRQLVGEGSQRQTLQMQFSCGDLDKALQRLEDFDVIGLTERMDYSRTMLLGALNVRYFRPEIPKFNAFEDVQISPNHKTIQREEITEEMEQMIAFLTEDDWEIYRYAEKLFNKRLSESITS